MSQVAAHHLRFAAASRTYPGETVNGDAWQVDWHAGACRIAVIDGLGHGRDAAAAAEVARGILVHRPDLPPAESLAVCHAGMAGTRGAAMSIACIDADGSRLTYAGVGNVDGHLMQDGRQQRLIAFRGIVGAALPTPRAFTFDLRPGWLLVMHTDGVRARFVLDDLTDSLRADPQQLAEAILHGWGRATDDAMIVVVQHTP